MSTTKLFNALVLVVLVGLVCGSGIFAQSERGTIEGTVRDSSGAVVVGAKVTITETATGAVATSITTGAGEYTIPDLAVGAYTVEVTLQGFRKGVISGLALHAGSTLRADVTLEVGATKESVEVQANALTVNAENAVMSTSVNNTLVDELPLVVSGQMRSSFDLASLTSEAKNLGGTTGFALGGGQAAAYGTQLDGVSSNNTRAQYTVMVQYNQPSLDAITEFSVETNGYKAEFGHASGGVMIFATKSGTNKFHGTTYEFLRNSDLDANNFFNNRAGLPVPSYKQSDFGASVGGPVWIPKLYHGKNKTFFFFAYEGFRNRAGATGSAYTIPTPEMYTGDFHNWVNGAGQMIPIYDPNSQTQTTAGVYTRTPFPGNMISPAEFDPVSVKVLNAFQTSSVAPGWGPQKPVGILRPNTGAAPGTIGYVQNNYIDSTGSIVNPENKTSVKIDQILTDKQRVSFFMLFTRASNLAGADGWSGLPGVYDNVLTNGNAGNHIGVSQVYRLGYDYTLRPNLFNHFFAGGNYYIETAVGQNAVYTGHSGWQSVVCVPNVPDCNQNLFQVGFSSNGYSTWGSQDQNAAPEETISFNDDLTWVRGKHTFKFGAMHDDLHYNGGGRQCDGGCASFSFLETGLPGNTNFTQAGGNPFASFLLGYADSGSADAKRYVGQQWSYWAGYAQDDYRVKSNLTLNLGLRWDTTLPPTFYLNQLSDFSPTAPNPGANNIPGALIFAGNCTMTTGAPCTGSKTLADSWFGGWGPHVGLAWSPGRNSKWVVRAGYARSFGMITTVSGSVHYQGFVALPSFTNNGSNGVTPAFQMVNGMPFWARPPDIDPAVANAQSVFWYQGHEATREPEANNWNLSIQRQLSTSMVLDLSYNGVAGSHLQAGLLQADQVNPLYLQKYGATLLTSPVNSPAAVAAGIQLPYANFLNTYTTGSLCACTVAQSLKPYPQFTGINTSSGGGDHSGHSTYHAGQVMIQKRAGNFTLQASYVLSKLLTNADSYWVGGAAMDFYNRRLEKSIGAYDLTHNVKISQVYELPFGKGKRFFTHGFASWALGGWRVASIQYYASGQPQGLTTTVSLPLGGGADRPDVPTYGGWRAHSCSGFDPSVNRMIQPASFFGAQPGSGSFGDETRLNPSFRQCPSLTENVSVSRMFAIWESVKLNFRVEGFNVLNRTQWGTGSLSLQSPTLGQLQSSADLLNTPRQLQLALKLYF
jgi:Carboxypeptidase regulatory-like domain